MDVGYTRNYCITTYGYRAVSVSGVDMIVIGARRKAERIVDVVMWAEKGGWSF